MTGGNRVAETSIPNNYRQSALSSITHTLHDTFIRHRNARARTRSCTHTRRHHGSSQKAPSFSTLISLARRRKNKNARAPHTHRVASSPSSPSSTHHHHHLSSSSSSSSRRADSPHRHTASHHHRFEFFVIIVNQSLSIKRVIVFPHIRCLKATVLNRQHRRTGPFLSHSLICRAAHVLDLAEAKVQSYVYSHQRLVDPIGTRSDPTSRRSTQAALVIARCTTSLSIAWGETARVKPRSNAVKIPSSSIVFPLSPSLVLVSSRSIYILCICFFLYTDSMHHQCHRGAARLARSREEPFHSPLLSLSFHRRTAISHRKPLASFTSPRHCVLSSLSRFGESSSSY